MYPIILHLTGCLEERGRFMPQHVKINPDLNGWQKESSILTLGLVRPRMNCLCALLCTATNKKLVTFLFWTATKTNYTSKCSDFQKKLIDTITTSNFYLNSKKTMKMTWLHIFLWVFLFQPTAKPNRPNSWLWQCCHSSPYIFHD